MTLKLIEKPTVLVVGRPQADAQALAQWAASFGESSKSFWSTSSKDGEILCEFAGRTCYGQHSFSKPRPGGSPAYFKNIIEHSHGNVLGHANYILAIRGISVTCATQLIRHHVGTNPSMLSGRFVDLSETAFVVPPMHLDGMRIYDSGNGWEHCSTTSPLYNPEAQAFELWRDQCQDALGSYQRQVGLFEKVKGTAITKEDRKRIREACRQVLPFSTETALFFTGNMRAWRNICEQRCNEHADAEIRRLCCEVFKMLSKEMPLAFEDYDIRMLDDGTFEITTPYRKI